MAEMLPGGWTSWKFVLEPAAQQLFDSVKKPVGIDYKPIAYATQPVAGTNYCFLCEGKVVHPGAVADIVAKIYILQPLPGPSAPEPHITQLVLVRPEHHA